LEWRHKLGCRQRELAEQFKRLDYLEQYRWRLEAQTNSLSAGIGTNWFTVSGSTAENQISFPPNTGNGSMFFRLAYP
jgi:hypothetical protein